MDNSNDSQKFSICNKCTHRIERIISMSYEEVDELEELEDSFEYVDLGINKTCTDGCQIFDGQILVHHVICSALQLDLLHTVLSCDVFSKKIEDNTIITTDILNKL